MNLDAFSPLIVAAVLGIFAVLSLLVLFVVFSGVFREMLEGTRAGESELVCRQCTSKSVHLSRPSGPVDAILSRFACAPYRCDVCAWRFYVRRSGASGRAASLR